MFRRLLALAAILIPTLAFGQGVILQGGPWAQNHAPMYVGPGGAQAIMQDSGPAGGGGQGLGLTELLLTQRGLGTGPFGTNSCDYDAPITTLTGFHYLCFSPNTNGGGLIAYGAGGGAAPLPLFANINGTIYPFPFAVGGIVGPTSTVTGHVALWANTAGTLLSDGGVLGSLAFINSPTPVLNGGTGSTTAVAARAALGNLIPSVSSIATLKALDLTGLASGALISLNGYYAIGDMPPVQYSLATSACNAADDGSQVSSNTSGNCWKLVPQVTLDPRYWGVVSGGTDPNGDNAVRFNKMIAYANTLSNLSGPVDMSCAGLTYAVGDMISLNANGLLLHSCTLIPTTAFVPGATKGVLGILNPASSVTVRDIFFDLQRLPVYAIYDSVPGLVTLEEISFRRWCGGGANCSSAGPSLDGGGIKFDANATVDLYRITGQQWTGQDPEFGDLTKRAGYNIWWTGTSGGSAADTVQLQGGLQTMHFDSGTGGVKFSHSYFLLGCKNSGCTDSAHLGQPQQDPVCIGIDLGASDIELSQTTFSSCKLTYAANHLNPPVLFIGAGMRYIYGSGGAAFTSNYGNGTGNFIEVTALDAGVNYLRFQVDAATNFLTAGNPFMAALLQTGSGSWSCGVSTLNTNVLAKLATQNSAWVPGCRNLSGGGVASLGDFLGIPGQLTTSDSMDKYCGEFVYLTVSAAATLTLPADTLTTCSIGLVQQSATAFPITLQAAPNASLNGTTTTTGTGAVTATKALTRFQACHVTNVRNVDGASAQWFTEGC